MRMQALLYILTFSILFCNSVATTFESACTLPPNGVNIVYSGNVRGTFDILWTCISTLLICTWTVQHLCIPEKEKVPKTIGDYWRIRAKEIWRRLKWMISTLLIPELLAGKEFQDLIMARKSCREMESFASEDGVEWNIIQAHYANLGGYVLEFQRGFPCEAEACQPTEKGEGQLKQQTASQEPTVPLAVAAERIFGTQNQGSAAHVNNFKVFFLGFRREPSSEEVPTVQTDDTPLTIIRFHPNADQILALRAHNILPSLPSVSTRNITDKGKGDMFVKATALLQVLWLSTQLAIRTSRHLPISHLELAVLAFSTCAIFTYLCSFNKPQGISEPTYIFVPIALDMPLLERIHAATREFRGYTGTRVSSLFIGGPPNINMLHPIPNDVEYAMYPQIRGWKLPFSYHFVGLTFAGTLFGIIHCLGWNFHFPSSTERLIWRVSSVLTAAWTPIYAVNFVTYKIFKVKFWGLLQLAQLIEIVLWFGYVTARCCLLVLVFRCLFFLERGAFVATLDGLVPHIH
jgi:hypothetical protein